MVTNLPNLRDRAAEIDAAFRADLESAERRRDAAQAALLREVLAESPPASPPVTPEPTPPAPRSKAAAKSKETAPPAQAPTPDNDDLY